MTGKLIPVRWEKLYGGCLEGIALQGNNPHLGNALLLAQLCEEIGSAEAERDILRTANKRLSQRIEESFDDGLEEGRAQQAATVDRLTKALSEFYTQVTIDDILSATLPK